MQKINKRVKKLGYMFTDILEKKELDHLFKTYEEGSSSADYIIIDIINELFKRKDDTIRNLTVKTTAVNIFLITKQKNKLLKGYNQVLNFYKDLEKRGMEKINIANIQLDKILDSLSEEIRKIKERETTILQLIAGILTLVIAIIAIFVSIFL